MAATGIDGVWFDVPFLVHNFGEGWEEQWSDHNAEAQAQAFSQPDANHVQTAFNLNIHTVITFNH